MECGFQKPGKPRNHLSQGTQEPHFSQGTQEPHFSEDIQGSKSQSEPKIYSLQNLNIGLIPSL